MTFFKEKNNNGKLIALNLISRKVNFKVKKYLKLPLDMNIMTVYRVIVKQ